MFKISIIIPTYRDTDRTIRLIKKLFRIEWSDKIFEIIIVDNNNSPEVFLTIDDNRLKVLHCAIPGSYCARNFGVQNASGDYMVFTDSDCDPSDDWFKNIYASLVKHQVDVIAGVTKISKGDSTKWAFLFEKVIAFNFCNMKKNRVATTSNLIIKKELLCQAGFNEKSFSGGDIEWTGNYSKLNSIHYSDEVIVYHPARKSIIEIINKDERVYGGFFKRKKKLPLFFSNFILPVTQFKLILKSNETTFDKVGLLALACFFRALRFYYHFKLLFTGEFRR
ncbi:glycosyltransferase [Pseudoalteromonas atlantica]|uniref:glycosyltransferase n=1 Tax=Pseudoalteromonas atlantica TaxID=288 RepID=UPI003735341C